MCKSRKKLLNLPARTWTLLGFLLVGVCNTWFIYVNVRHGYYQNAFTIGFVNLGVLVLAVGSLFQNLGDKYMDILIRYVDPDSVRLEKIAVGDWIDLRARQKVDMKYLDYCEVPLGVVMRLPEGYEAHVKPRSGTFKHWGILQTNSEATIDESYCGQNDEWKFPALAMRDTVIEKGDRICQFRIVRKMPKVRFIEVVSMDGPDRGGFGTTGKS